MLKLALFVILYKPYAAFLWARELLFTISDEYSRLSEFECVRPESSPHPVRGVNIPNFRTTPLPGFRGKGGREEKGKEGERGEEKGREGTPRVD